MGIFDPQNTIIIAKKKTLLLFLVDELISERIFRKSTVWTAVFILSFSKYVKFLQSIWKNQRFHEVSFIWARAARKFLLFAASFVILYEYNHDFRTFLTKRFSDFAKSSAKYVKFCKFDLKYVKFSRNYAKKRCI